MKTIHFCHEADSRNEMHLQDLYEVLRNSGWRYEHGYLVFGQVIRFRMETLDQLDTRTADRDGIGEISKHVAKVLSERFAQFDKAFDERHEAFTAANTNILEEAFYHKRVHELNDREIEINKMEKRMKALLHEAEAKVPVTDKIVRGDGEPQPVAPLPSPPVRKVAAPAPKPETVPPSDDFPTVEVDAEDWLDS